MFDQSLYEALNRAADVIEKKPKSFDFYTHKIPSADDGYQAHQGFSGCAIGHTIDQLGVKTELPGTWSYGDAVKYLHVDEQTFYERMYDLVGYGWNGSASLAASAMRQYAQKYVAEPFKKLSRIREMDRGWI